MSRAVKRTPGGRRADVPAPRRRLEARLLEALGAPEAERWERLEDGFLNLRGFAWGEHPELVCIAFAEMVAVGARAAREELLEASAPRCQARARAECARCLLHQLRAAT